ncbi:hypothetical protein CSW58_04530 [Caulobacter sp. B11]|nr:hypothetical protein CSW58_04530 [Caulobacter sp. B11]
MSEVKKFRMRPRLAQLVKQSGGMYVTDALKRADAALEVMREPLLTSIDDYLVKFDTLLEAPDAPDLIDTLYRCSADVISLSGAEQTDAVQTAARSLCDLVGEAGAVTPALLAGIKVHVASIKLLHRATLDPATQAPILAGLARVLEKQRGGEA